MACVSHTAPYRHFPDCNALLAAIAEDGFRSLAQTMKASLIDIEDPFDRLFSIIRAYGLFGLNNRALYRLLFSEQLSFGICNDYQSLREATNALFGILLEEISRGQSLGYLRACPTKELGVILWSMVHGIVSLLIEERIDCCEKQKLPSLLTDPDNLLRGIFSILLDGMKANALAPGK